MKLACRLFGHLPLLGSCDSVKIWVSWFEVATCRRCSERYIVDYDWNKHTPARDRDD